MCILRKSKRELKCEDLMGSLLGAKSFLCSSSQSSRFHSISGFAPSLVGCGEGLVAIEAGAGGDCVACGLRTFKKIGHDLKSKLNVAPSPG